MGILDGVQVVLVGYPRSWGRRREWEEREIKKELLHQLSRAPERVRREFLEWLWEEHGVEARGREWGEVERRVLSEKSLTSREIAVFMLGEGVSVDEDLWLDRARSRVRPGGGN